VFFFFFFFFFQKRAGGRFFFFTNGQRGRGGPHSFPFETLAGPNGVGLGNAKGSLVSRIFFFFRDGLFWAGPPAVTGMPFFQHRSAFFSRNSGFSNRWDRFLLPPVRSPPPGPSLFRSIFLSTRAASKTKSRRGIFFRCSPAVPFYRTLPEKK